MLTHALWYADLQWGSQFPFRQSHNDAPKDLEIMVISDDEEIPTPQQGKQLHKQWPAEARTEGSITTSCQYSDTCTKSCAGYHLSFPRGQQAHTSYPFALHMIMLLPWDYSTQKDAFVLMSHTCAGKAEVDGCCKACDSLGKNECLKNIIIRYTNGVSENTQLVYHGIAGLINIVHRKTSTIDVLRLCHLNDTRKLVGYKGVIDIHNVTLQAGHKIV